MGGRKGGWEGGHKAGRKVKETPGVFPKKLSGEPIRMPDTLKGALNALDVIIGKGKVTTKLRTVRPQPSSRERAEPRFIVMDRSIS